jgi:hypothetical protein
MNDDKYPGVGIVIALVVSAIMWAGVFCTIIYF